MMASELDGGASVELAMRGVDAMREEEDVEDKSSPPSCLVMRDVDDDAMDATIFHDTGRQAP